MLVRFEAEAPGTHSERRLETVGEIARYALPPVPQARQRGTGGSPGGPGRGDRARGADGLSVRLTSA